MNEPKQLSTNCFKCGHKRYSGFVIKRKCFILPICSNCCSKLMGIEWDRRNLPANKIPNDNKIRFAKQVWTIYMNSNFN